MARIEMTRMTKVALYFLRFYLVALLILLLIKFLQVIHH
jgi:hypothetical protein